YDRAHLQRVRVVGMRHDPHASVLRDRTGCPAGAGSGSEPAEGLHVHRMILVEERDEDVHVEQRAHQKASSSRNLSICSLVTIPPRLGNGRNPCTALDPRAAGVGAVNALRVSSEMTAPAVFFSRRASSLAARSTSSSMSSVVRMHLMLLHHMECANPRPSAARPAACPPAPNPPRRRPRAPADGRALPVEIEAVDESAHLVDADSGQYQ